jgi:hypothetical protein
MLAVEPKRCWRMATARAVIDRRAVAVSHRQSWVSDCGPFRRGVTNTLQGVALLYYLQASPSIQELIYGVIMSAPWNLKILFAFLSGIHSRDGGERAHLAMLTSHLTTDCVPIFGQRRKPYFLEAAGGIVLQAASWLIFGLDPPSIGMVAALGFTATRAKSSSGPCTTHSLSRT